MASSRLKFTFAFTFTGTQPSNNLRVFCPDVRDAGITEVLYSYPCVISAVCVHAASGNAGLSPGQRFTRPRNSDRLTAGTVAC